MLAKQLGLIDDQVQKVQAIYDRMNSSAKSLGGEVIAREQNLDPLFATGHVTPDRLAAETEALGALQAVRLHRLHDLPGK